MPAGPSVRATRGPAWRKCLFLYFYFLDREFGFCHARVQTWFPFTMQVYVNGHEWLARQMDKRGLRYRRLDNAFLWLDDPGRVQRLADRFAPLDWPAVLDRFAHRVNPPGAQAPCGFAGEIMNDWKRRWPGARVKHWMKGTGSRCTTSTAACCASRPSSTIRTNSKSVAAPGVAGGGLSGGTPCRKAWPFCRAMPPCPRPPIIATSMRSPSSAIPPLRIGPSIVSCNRLATSRPSAPIGSSGSP